MSNPRNPTVWTIDSEHRIHIADHPSQATPVTIPWSPLSIPLVHPIEALGYRVGSIHPNVRAKPLFYATIDLIAVHTANGVLHLPEPSPDLTIERAVATSITIDATITTPGAVTPIRVTADYILDRSHNVIRTTADPGTPARAANAAVSFAHGDYLFFHNRQEELLDAWMQLTEAKIRNVVDHQLLSPAMASVTRQRRISSMLPIPR